MFILFWIFSGHGLKVQAITFPNGMFGSIYLGAWRISDASLLNMSVLDTYLVSLFTEFNICLTNTCNQFPGVYSDGIFPQLATIVAHYAQGDVNESRVNRCLAGACQSIEHLFCIHHNKFLLFNIPDQFKLLVHGIESVTMMQNSFFLLNCYNTFNESPKNFDLRPPTIEEYLPLDEELKHAPQVTDDLLGDVYVYDYHY